MTFTIRCLTGTTELWAETFSKEQDASHYYLHKAKLAQQYGPTALPFRIQFMQGDALIDEFTTTGDGGMTNLVKEGRPMPKKLSEWLRVAVEDVRRIPAECSTPELRFTANMSSWVHSKDGTCSACLAGSALLGTGLWRPSNRFAADNAIALALNELRGGNVDGALDAFAEGATGYAYNGDALTPRVERAAERVFREAWDAHSAEDSDSYTREEAIDELGGYPSPGARASDEAYIELADALEEMGL